MNTTTTTSATPLVTGLAIAAIDGLTKELQIQMIMINISNQSNHHGVFFVAVLYAVLVKTMISFCLES